MGELIWEMLGGEMLGGEMLGEEMLGEEMLGEEMLGEEMLGGRIKVRELWRGNFCLVLHDRGLVGLNIAWQVFDAIHRYRKRVHCRGVVSFGSNISSFLPPASGSSFESIFFRAIAFFSSRPLTPVACI